MKKFTKTHCLFPVLTLSIGLLVGCGQKRIETTQVPQTAPGNAPTVAQAPKPVRFASYRVKRHDNLWAIAGKPGIYGDSFLWPELFKANRDQIKDPDLIFPRQDLRVDRDPTQEERNHAKQMAQLTPKFVPHSSPRESLPLDYF